MKKDKKTIKWGEYMDGALLDRWPRTADDEPEEPAFLCTRSSTESRTLLLLLIVVSF